MKPNPMIAAYGPGPEGATWADSPNPLQRARDAGFSPADALALIAHPGLRAPNTALRKRYERTDWFRDLAVRVAKLYGSCVLCGRDTGLVPHHRHYRTLFREDLHADVTALCKRCHGSYHRGARR